MTVHATLHGTITDTGGENCDFRGFVWDTASHGDPGNVAPGASGYILGNWTEGNSYGVNPFSHEVINLAEGDTFYVRACAHNSAGWSYGGEVSFDTPTAPTTRTKTVSMDTLLEAIDSEIINLDTILRATDVKTVSLSTLLKGFGIPKTIDLDTFLKALGITRTVDLDTLLVTRGGQTIDLDTLLHGFGIAKTIDLDTLLQGFGITKTITLDTLLMVAGITRTIDLDTILKATAVKTVDLDTILKAFGVTSTVDLSILLRVTDTQTVALDTKLIGRAVRTIALDVILIAYPEKAVRYILEIHQASTGNLIAILNNAHRIDFSEAINEAPTLAFDIPADDSKVADILKANEIWLRDYESGSVVKKFRLTFRGDIRR